MAGKETKQANRQEAEKSPVVWLTVYEAAVRRGDVALANRARRELAKRGVVIQHYAPDQLRNQSPV